MRRIVAGLAGCTLVLILVAWLGGWLSPLTEQPASPTAGVVDEDMNSAATDAPTAPTAAMPGRWVPPATPMAAAEAAAPLPPLDAPLAETFDALLERMRRGDARAACRLSLDLARCFQHAEHGRWGRTFEREAVRAQDPARASRLIDNAAHMQEMRQRNDLFCAGVAAEQLEWSFPAQLAAARWNPGMRVWAASAPALDQLNFLADLEGWEQYRAVALPWLLEAGLAGDPAAQILLARVYGDDRRPRPPIPPFRSIDDAQFVTWASVLARRGIVFEAVERAAGEAQARLGPQASAQALAEAERILTRGPADPLGAAEREAATRISFAPAPGNDSCE